MARDDRPPFYCFYFWVFMKFSRRQFLYAASVTTAVPALQGTARAFAGIPLLYPPENLSSLDKAVPHGHPEILVGYAAITWGGNDTQAIADIASLGYRGIQLRANTVKEFPAPHALRDLLHGHALQFAALSSGDVLIDPSQEAANLALHEANAKYLHAAGGTLLQVIGTFGQNNSTFSAEDCKRQGKLLTEVAKRAADSGVKTGFHNHMGSIGQTPEQIDMILDASDPRYVKLLLDTGHYQQGGGDPVAAVKKYSDRILFLHLKDVKPSTSKSGYEFTELGDGKVDFPAVISALRSIDFRGWAIVELDKEPAGSATTPKESAAMSKRYLEQTLNLQV
jgi:inosose dehydratase